jgi:hypothetical protein
MGYRMMGALHAWLRWARTEQAGQGTVEYVALILLVAGVLAGVVAAGRGMNGGEIAKTIVGKLTDSIEAVGNSG